MRTDGVVDSFPRFTGDFASILELEYSPATMHCSSAGKEAAKWCRSRELGVRPEPLSGCQRR